MEMIWDDISNLLNVCDDIETPVVITSDVIDNTKNSVQSCLEYINSFCLDLINDNDLNIDEQLPVSKNDENSSATDTTDVEDGCSVNVDEIQAVVYQSCEILEYDPLKPGLRGETYEQIRGKKSRHESIEEKFTDCMNHDFDVAYFSNLKRRRLAKQLANASLFISETPDYSKICERTRIFRSNVRESHLC